MYKASPHHRSRKVIKYFEENKDTDSNILPTASPEVYGDGRGMEHVQK